MNVQVAILCDAATQEAGSEKLNLLGAFDTIYAQQLPAIHPQCAVALRITFATAEEGPHKLALTFINADGRPVMPAMEIPVAVALPEDVHFVTRNFVVNIQKLKFAEVGLYSVDILMDGRSLASIPLQVKLMPQAAA
ncbi:MAG: hypothetical protein ABSC24_04415 [Verrucomicrobiota bacterium]|jgi:hypothetical protein